MPHAMHDRDEVRASWAEARRWSKCWAPRNFASTTFPGRSTFLPEDRDGGQEELDPTRRSSSTAGIRPET